MTIGGKGAELVLVNGKIRTPAHPSGFVRAAAVSGGMIMDLCADDEIRDYIGPFTRVLNLRGRLAVPAFGDAHVRPVLGGLESLRCDLAGRKGRAEYLDTISLYSKSLVPSAWVLGGGWSMTGFPGGTPTASDLDAVTGGRPAFLPNREHHSAWVNGAALAIAGVTKTTPDPADGRIERDNAGEPTGALHGGALRLVADYVPQPSPAQLTAALLAGQRQLHSLGITSVQDACVGDAGEVGVPDTFATYTSAAADRLLTCRVTGALCWDRLHGLHQLDALQARREQADGGGYFRATAVKLMLDGVSETFTAAMGSPNLFIEPDELAETAAALADLGFQLHLHAAGDRAAGAALDALAGLSEAQRISGRHHIAHLQFISPADLERFAQLRVTATVQPLRAEVERANWQYRIGSLLRLGTRVAFGSDWPAASADPIQGLHVAVNRTLPQRLGEPEAIGLDAAVSACTSAVAYLNHEEDVAGTLERGMVADFAVLDQDLYAIGPDAIGDTSVALTVASGRVVHGDE
jgi:predicted amidohydrolase YtcJ